MFSTFSKPSPKAKLKLLRNKVLPSSFKPEPELNSNFCKKSSLVKVALTLANPALLVILNNLG